MAIDPQQQFNPEELAALESMLASRLESNEKALMGPMANPELVAELQRSMLAPQHPTLPINSQHAKKSGEPPYMALGGMACATAVVITWIVAASLPGARGTAEINTALMTMAESSRAIAENQDRPNHTCISLWCGGRPEKAVGSTPVESVEQSPYQQGLVKAAKIYAPVVDSPRHIQSAIARIESEKLPMATSGAERQKWQAHLDYLKGL